MPTDFTSKDGPTYVQAEPVHETARRDPPDPPHQLVLRQSGGLFGRLGKYLWLALIVSVLANVAQRTAYKGYFLPTDEIREKYHSLSKNAEDKVAVIRVEGPLLQGDGFVKKQIDQVSRDKSVKAVVLRIDSPGGTVTASDYIYHHLKEMVLDCQIPLVVSMGSLCASGGYYVAMAVGNERDAIFAEPTTWTGSIGVIIPHYDVSELLDHWHVKDDSIASHRFKQLGSPTRKLSKDERMEERKILQTMVDDSFDGFKRVVCSGRPRLRDDESLMTDVATGQVFTANQALDHGLIDRIGFVEDAIDRVIELAGLEKDQVRVVKYKQRDPGLIELLGGRAATVRRMAGVDLAWLFDLSAPRAYYLCTWMPSIVTSARP